MDSPVRHPSLRKKGKALIETALSPPYEDKPENLESERLSPGYKVMATAVGREDQEGRAGPGVPSRVLPVAPPERTGPPLQGHGVALSPSLARSTRSCKAWCSLWLAEGDGFLGPWPTGGALGRVGGVCIPSSG